MARNPSYESYRSPSPALHPGHSHGYVNGNGAAGPSRKALVRDPRLIGSEDVWEETLRIYQKKREAEAAEIAELGLSVSPPHYLRTLTDTEKLQHSPSAAASSSRSKKPRKSGIEYEAYPPLPGPYVHPHLPPHASYHPVPQPHHQVIPQPQAIPDSRPPSSATPAPSNPDDSAKISAKRKGWPADHPTRIAQREAREAAIAAGIELPKRKYNRKSRKEKAAELDDELLGLAEGEVGQSSPMPMSDAFDGEEGEDELEPGPDVPVEPGPPAEPLHPGSIVLPCGLTRAEVIAKVEVNDMLGLTENDVKAVQDEMWMRRKEASGGAPIRKDGTVRKKPGPAKGWKKLRGEVGGGSSSRKDGGGGSVKDYESDAGDTSVAGDTVNGEAETDIAALLPPDDGPRKRVKLEHDEDDDEEMDEDDDDDGRRGSVDEDGVRHSSSRNPKTKEPGVGKGRWTRPTKPEKELLKMAEEIAVQVEAEVEEDLPGNNVEMSAPNSQDPRGVSETEAKIRLHLVEELQRQAWLSIVRDIPRVGRSA